MSEINFKYIGKNIPIKFNPEEKIGILINRFCIKTNVNKNNVKFILNNSIVDEELTVKKLFNHNKRLSIIVLENDKMKKKNINNNTNEIRIKYKKIRDTEDRKIKIFGSYFVNNNQENWKIIYKGKEYKLQDTFYIGYHEELEIILKAIDNITNLDSMFWGCESLISLPDISNLNTNNVTDMSSMFYGCISLSSLPDISKWNTKNVKYMTCMFADCISLLSLPDISKWNICNLEVVAHMFCKCSSLSSLPDISKWNTSKISDMDGIFSGCSSLSTLPDISKWNTKNVYSMKHMFYGCTSLSFLPDISKWNTYSLTNVNDMFFGCLSLISLPRIINSREESHYIEPTEWEALSGEEGYYINITYYSFK